MQEQALFEISWLVTSCHETINGTIPEYPFVYREYEQLTVSKRAHCLVGAFILSLKDSGMEIESTWNHNQTSLVWP